MLNQSNKHPLESFKKVLVTGANGFIAKNLLVHLREFKHLEIETTTRSDDHDSLRAKLKGVDLVFHLAGENRPTDNELFDVNNANLTRRLCDYMQQECIVNNSTIPVVFSSSTQVLLDNEYGKSKLAAEQHIKQYSNSTQSPSLIFRLPGVFGKWSKPNYNTVVATFCYNLSRGLPIEVHSPEKMLDLVYIDDVIHSMLKCLESMEGCLQQEVQPQYSISLGALAEQIMAFEKCRDDLIVERVGTDLTRALYATYISFLPNERFHYRVPSYTDPRGSFVEMLKTKDSGQFSFFTALPGVTRGGHYHHTKSEKFLVLKGEALFRFRHLLTDELYELNVSGEAPQIVDTIPGWSHDITNTGLGELIVMLWANEIFDRENPDTFSSKVAL